MLENVDPVEMIRLLVFISFLLLLFLLQTFFPRRKEKSTLTRRFSNISIAMINVLTLSLLSLSAVAASLYANEHLWGVFYHWELSLWPQIILTIIFLDFVVYCQHRYCHSSGTFWRLHRMHHTDNMVDVTTALRFHPFEIIVSMLLKCGAVLLLGAPLLGVILFEIILNSAAMFNHCNWSLSKRVDKWLRLLVVTPDMHRVHHSQIYSERNHNYGFFLSIWDRIFGSYKAQPDLGHDDMAIGLKPYSDHKQNWLHVMLANPAKANLYQVKKKQNQKNSAVKNGVEFD